MTDPTPTPEQQADLEAARLRLRNAKEELADRIRREKAAELVQPAADDGARPLPSIPLGQRVDTHEDRIKALEARMDLAAKYVKQLERELRAAVPRPRTTPKPKPKAGDNGPPAQAVKK